ncbi:toll/interleukin-1 receptor domain-containing protein [Streptomyces sp. ZAF1911]|uniref:toll/interleukin-1 receptor domain-containing protein n=1 Tax=Streptomyces sp. ZAF1911 TaxID=2944129 RepID=UPI00237BC071|nr:toll/interleukin-1 receptor domain-containing protein [Streptomyces sp. ZAF1911]MDD9376938.1 toll/interleukin-1 receptor domain-containing protein [Streptomyces sp. ZAF1911]
MNTDDTPAGFWSYTHRDDEIEGGRIRRLALKIANEFEVITADELRVFLDKNDIKWGHEWRDRIDNALTSATFFMPIITPRFFKSDECRREVLTFSGHAKSLGLEELLLPILYTEVPAIRKGDTSDEVVSLISKRQYEDWTALRLEDEDSPTYRKAVHRLATRLVEILERANEVAVPEPPNLDSAESDDEPGTLELMSDAEAALPRWGSVMTEFASTITEIGELTRAASDEMSQSDARGGGFAGRLRLTHQLAQALQQPVDRLGELGLQYSAELVTIDPAILGIIRQVESEGTAGSAETQEFFVTIKDFAEKGRGNSEAFQGFIESVGTVSGLSKSMRPLTRKIQGAVQQILDGQSILNEWERRINEIGDGQSEA